MTDNDNEARESRMKNSTARLSATMKRLAAPLSDTDDIDTNTLFDAAAEFGMQADMMPALLTSIFVQAAEAQPTVLPSGIESQPVSTQHAWVLTKVVFELMCASYTLGYERHNKEVVAMSLFNAPVAGE